MVPRALAPLFVAALVATPLATRAADASKTAREAEDTAAAAEDEGGRASEGGEPAKTLAERIPSVTRRSFAKQGRVEVFPTVSLSLNDPFYDHVIGTLGIGYHVLESLSIGLAGDFYGSLSTSVPVVGKVGPTTVTVDRPKYAGRLELAWSPFYGKVSLFAENVLHFDIYLLAGGGMMGRERGGSTFTGVGGLGEHFFFNDWIGLRLEVRDQLFMLARQPASAAGGASKQSLQNLLSVMVGLSFFLPPSFKAEQL
jgi:outer membrane beta-barrel protein